MAKPGIELETPATIVRSSTTELPKPKLTVHIVQTTTSEIFLLEYYYDENINLVQCLLQKRQNECIHSL